MHTEHPVAWAVMGTLIGGVGSCGFVVHLVRDHQELLDRLQRDGVVRVVGPMLLTLAFLVVALACATVGVRAVRREGRARHWRRRHPDQPWVEDHPWNEQGVWEGVSSQPLNVLVWSGAMLLFGGALTTWAFDPEGGGSRSLIKPLAVLLDLGALYLAVTGLTNLVRAHRPREKRIHGYLRFAQFPYRLGGPLEAHLQVPAAVQVIDSLQLTLRCVEERWHPERMRRGDLACWQIYAETQRLGAHRPGSELTIAFELPDGDYATRLSEHPPRYWELEVACEPSSALDGVFLLPVYERTAEDTPQTDLRWKRAAPPK
jgi:hypothetical protein